MPLLQLGRKFRPVRSSWAHLLRFAVHSVLTNKTTLPAGLGATSRRQNSSANFTKGRTRCCSGGSVTRRKPADRRLAQPPATISLPTLARSPAITPRHAPCSPFRSFPAAQEHKLYRKFRLLIDLRS